MPLPRGRRHAGGGGGEPLPTQARPRATRPARGVARRQLAARRDLAGRSRPRRLAADAAVAERLTGTGRQPEDERKRGRDDGRGRRDGQGRARGDWRGGAGAAPEGARRRYSLHAAGNPARLGGRRAGPRDFDPLPRAAARAGGDLHGRRLCPRDRPARCRHGCAGPRRAERGRRPRDRLCLQFAGAAAGRPDPFRCDRQGLRQPARAEGPERGAPRADQVVDAGRRPRRACAGDRRGLRPDERRASPPGRGRASIRHADGTGRGRRARPPRAGGPGRARRAPSRCGRLAARRRRLARPLCRRRRARCRGRDPRPGGAARRRRSWRATTGAAACPTATRSPSPPSEAGRSLPGPTSFWWSAAASWTP